MFTIHALPLFPRFTYVRPHSSLHVLTDAFLKHISHLLHTVFFHSTWGFTHSLYLAYILITEFYYFFLVPFLPTGALLTLLARHTLHYASIWSSRPPVIPLKFFHTNHLSWNPLAPTLNHNLTFCIGIPPPSCVYIDIPTWYLLNNHLNCIPGEWGILVSAGGLWNSGGSYGQARGCGQLWHHPRALSAPQQLVRLSSPPHGSGEQNNTSHQ